MKNNNMARESIPNMEFFHSNHGFACGIALMPMKEVYQKMYTDFSSLSCALSIASNSREVRATLSEIYQYPVDSRVSEGIKYSVEEIKKRVHLMHTNDFTRAQMCNDLAVLLSKLTEAIEEEDLQEKIQDARNAFKFMADHAEDFVDWVLQMQQKDDDK